MSASQVARGTGKRGGQRGRGASSRGSNRGGRSGNRGAPASPAAVKDTAKGQEITPQNDAVAPVVEPSESGEADVCWICAEPVKYYAVSACNHRTCHVCALRLRALYKKTDCTFCKEPQPTVVFTTSPDAPYDSYTPESTPYKDSKLAILFETQEMMEETLILLRFNCPDPDCDYIGNGWGDLKLHIRASHGKLLCDLCLRFKKVFAHEHALYPPAVLPIHLPSLHQQRSNKNISESQVEGGVHPLCEFCRECFFSSDELYPHMRERHEECFICKRNEVRDQYFLNYESLEKHFNSVHFPCSNKECQARKFVVFNSDLDLRAHMVEEHGGDMTSRDKKDARRVQAEFAFEDVGRQGRRADNRPRDHGDQQQRQQQPAQQSVGAPSSSRPLGSGDRRRAAFGGTLTTDRPQPPSRNTPNQSRLPSPPPESNVDPATAERHALFLSRLESVATNPSAAVPAVRAATRGYRASEASARDLISTIWNVLDQNQDNTANVVNAFVDLLDEEEKKQDLLASWRGFVIEQRRQFPELVPSAVGSEYAGITSGRVLNAKHSTAARSSQQSSRQLWDRVARAASSSAPVPSSVPGSTSYFHSTSRPPDRFPPLGSNNSSAAVNAGSAAPVPAYRQGQRTTPWAASSSAAASGTRAPGPPMPAVSVKSSPAASSRPGSATAKRAPPPPLSKSQFPELPSSSNTRQKPQVRGNVSLKNILGAQAAPVVPAWQGDAGNGAGASPELDLEAPGDGEAAPAAVSGGKRKKKGKQKQTLFTLGAFPA